MAEWSATQNARIQSLKCGRNANVFRPGLGSGVTGTILGQVAAERLILIEDPLQLVETDDVRLTQASEAEQENSPRPFLDESGFFELVDDHLWPR